MTKKVSFLLCLFVLLTAFQCEDEPLEGTFLSDQEAACVEAAQLVASALLDFVNANSENYSELCNVYKTALEQQLETCGDNAGSLQNAIDALGNCTQDDNSDTDCNNAQTETQQAATALANAETDDDYASACDAYKQAIQNEINECGDDDGSLQALLDDLGSDCSISDNSDDIEISVVAGTNTIEFDVVQVVENGNILEVSGEETSSGFTVYFEVEQGLTGTDIINSTFVLGLTSDFFPSTQGFDDFTSEIVENTPGTLFGTFFGLVENADGAEVSLTQGQILISY